VESPRVARDVQSEERVDPHDAANVPNQVATARSRQPDLSRSGQAEKPRPFMLLAEKRGLKHARIDLAFVLIEDGSRLSYPFPTPKGECGK